MIEIFSNPFVSGGLALGAVAAAGAGLRNLAIKGFKKLKEHLVFRAVIYDYDELFYVLENWIANNCQEQYKNLEASYEQTRRYVLGIDDVNWENRTSAKKIHWKQEPNIFTFKYEGKTLIFEKNKKELDHAMDLRQALNFHYSISAWKGKEVIQKFLQDLTDKYNSSLNNGKISLYVPQSSEWVITGKKSVKTLDKVVLKKEVKEFIIKDLDNFSSNREWYKEISVPYKRSFLFYGPGGTGKSTLAQGIAAYLKKDVYILNLNSVSDDTALMNLFSKLPDNSLLLIEDVDCAFNKRIPTTKNTKITFSCVLNCLDGAISKEGVITILTTNHIEKLDPALIRAGRMDIKIEMPFASKEEIEEYFQLFYKKSVLIPEGTKLNMSAVQEACIQNPSSPDDAVNNILSQCKKEIKEHSI